MKFKDEVKAYLRDEKFSNSLQIKIGEKQERITNRIDYLRHLSHAKNIIHVGCCEHLALIESKRKKGIWLHGILTEHAAHCYGIDIDKEALSYLRNELKMTNAHYCNVIEDPVPQEVKAGEWDYMILGEILEHTSNPCLFLEHIRQKYAGHVEKLVITVPNAFSHINLAHLDDNVEVINTDHRYWFTPYTLAKVATDAGFEVLDFELADPMSTKVGLRSKLLLFPWIKRLNRLKKLRHCPVYRDTVIMTLGFQ